MTGNLGKQCRRLNNCRRLGGRFTRLRGRGGLGQVHNWLRDRRLGVCFAGTLQLRFFACLLSLPLLFHNRWQIFVCRLPPALETPVGISKMVTLEKRQSLTIHKAQLLRSCFSSWMCCPSLRTQHHLCPRTSHVCLIASSLESLSVFDFCSLSSSSLSSSTAFAFDFPYSNITTVTAHYRTHNSLFSFLPLMNQLQQLVLAEGARKLFQGEYGNLYLHELSSFRLESPLPLSPYFGNGPVCRGLPNSQLQ